MQGMECICDGINVLGYLTLTLQLTTLGLKGGSICLAYNLSQSISLKSSWSLIFSWSSMHPSLSVGSLWSNCSMADHKNRDGDSTGMTYFVYKVQCITREPPWVDYLLITNTVEQLLLIITIERRL